MIEVPLGLQHIIIPVLPQQRSSKTVHRSRSLGDMIFHIILLIYLLVVIDIDDKHVRHA